jgi:hypothetical protein
MVIDGKTYTVKNTTIPTVGDGSLKIYRGTAVRAGGVTDPLEVYAPMKLLNGEELSLTSPVTLTNASYYQVPGNNSVSGGEGMWTFKVDTTLAISPGGYTFLAGNVNYTVVNATVAGTTAVITPTNMNLTGNTYSVGAMIVEERDAASSRNVVKIPITVLTGTPNRVSPAGITTGTTYITGAQISGATAEVATTDTYTTKSLDIYGTYVVNRQSSVSQHTYTISYPNDQAAGVVAIGSNPVITVGGTSTGATLEVANPIKTSIAKLDTEITDADKQTQNLILVGGPCVNQITALALGLTYPACGATSGVPANAAMIKFVDNAFVSGKAALVVAGWEAVNTRDATSVLQKFDSYSSQLVGTQVKVSGTTVTQITSA